MTTDDAIRILTQEEAVERLLARGWVRVTCAACSGAGHFVEYSEQILAAMTPHEAKESRICLFCGGNGTTWQKPSSP